MNLARARVFFIVDLIIISTIVFAVNYNFSPVQEPVLKQFVLVICFLIFIYTFDGYEVYQEYGQNLIYTALLVIGFSLIAATLLNYVVFFKTFGRKIYLLISLIMFFYLVLRYSLLAKAFSSVRKNIYLVGDKKLDCLKWGNVVCLSSVSQLPKLNYYDIVIVEDKKFVSDEDLKHLFRLKLQGYKIFNLIDFYEFFLRKIPVNLIEDKTYFFKLNTYKHYDHFFRKGYAFIKRVIDLAAAFSILIIALPVMLFTAVAIKIESEGEVIFKQKRTGLNGKPFTLYKFRSMRKDAEKDGAKWAKENDDRVTKVGKFIRKTRIDELPQLVNVIKGDMSLIGPRPERPEFDKTLEKQIPYYSLRYLVKPGLTGWAQVNYPYGASVEDAEQKLTYDLYYVKNASVFLDAEIALKTVKIIFLAKGR